MPISGSGQPEDSVLRRHYDQQNAATDTDSAPAEAEHSATTVSAEVVPLRRPPLAEPTRPSQPEARKGGLFGWLARLFGG